MSTAIVLGFTSRFFPNTSEKPDPEIMVFGRDFFTIYMLTR